MKQENVTLRHLIPSDEHELWHYVSDPTVTRFLTWENYTSRDEYEQYFSQAINKTSYPDEVLAVVYNTTVIGSVHIIARQHQAVQFGFGIIPAYCHQGLGTEVVRLALMYLKDQDQWVKLPVWADVHQRNTIAVRILKKTGFKLAKNGIENNRDRYIFTQEY